LCVTAAPSRAQQRVVGQTEAKRLASAENWLIRKTSPDGRTLELQGLADNIPLYYETHNLTAARTVGTANLWPGGPTALALTGAGVTIGAWDAGRVRSSHQEFGGRVAQADGFPETSDHATHVAGTILGAGLSPNDGTHLSGQSIGMAFEAELVAYDFNRDVEEMTTAAAGGLRLSSHAYGLVTGWDFDDYGAGEGWYWFGNTSVSMVEDYHFGFYSYQARRWDSVAHKHPDYLVVKSAGNDRDDAGPGTGTHFVSLNGAWLESEVTRNPDGNDGYDSLSHAATAKNVLTVGAVADLPGGYLDAAGVQLAAFSGCGPTDDGRIKPDIVANGTQLWSASSAAIDAYASRTGTSMATGSVTGSLGMLIEYYRQRHEGQDMSAAMLKGLVIHTADEAGDTPGPDYRHGWGLLNTTRAAEQVSRATAIPELIQELVIARGDVFELDVASTDSSMRFTICWTDPPGTTPEPAVDPPGHMLVNDLDLRVIDPNGVPVEPWVLDPSAPAAPATRGHNEVDNAEMVQIDGTIPGVYRVQISGRTPIVGDDQRVALLMSGARAEQEIIGACCDSSQCSDVSEEICLAFGHTWFGGVDCNSFSCPQLGACCLGCGGAASCTRIDRLSCLDQGGAWQEADVCLLDLCGASGDDCTTDALPVSDGVWPFDNRCATTDGPETVSCENGDQPFRNDLWYHYTATCTGTVTVSTCGDADYDVVLAVYGDGSNTCACPVDATTQLGRCADDTCLSGGGPAKIQRWAMQGECLTLRVGGWSGLTGTGNLSISCEPSPCLGAPTPLREPTPLPRNRYLALIPPATEEPAAIRVRGVDLDGFSQFNGAERWVGPPGEYPNSGAEEPFPPLTVSRLRCDPVFMDWSSVGLLYVAGAEIVPNSRYEVVAVLESCTGVLGDADAYSPPLELTTAIWGDTRESFAAPGGPTQPDMLDIAAIIQTFVGNAFAFEKPRVQLHPNVADPASPVDFRDIGDAINAFLILPYPYEGPCTCPPAITCNKVPCAVSLECPDGLCVDGFCRDVCARCIQP